MCLLAGVIAQATVANGDFRRLDSLIAAQPQIVEAKEAYLEQLKGELARETSLRGRYAATKRLYEQYSAYQYDSAYAYVSRCIHLAQEMGDAKLLDESRLNLAHILSTACLMDKARQTLDLIDATHLSTDQLIVYHRTRINLLIYQAEYMQGTQYAQEYVQQLVDLRRHIHSLSLPTDDINYLLTASEQLADNQQPLKAIELLATQALPRYHSGERLYSVITSTMAFHYSQMGDSVNQMRYLIKSAESDLEGCIRENTSLRAIADRLFDEGDIDRAYHYMRVAVDDANFYGTRLRNIQASHIVPKILSAYQTKQDQSRRNMMWLLAAISVIALLLVAGIIFVYQLLGRYRRLNEQKRAINAQLQQAGQQLSRTVEQLQHTNGLLREREKLKEEYVVRFLTLSSSFIDRAEQQRKTLYRLHRDHKAEDLARELRSSHFEGESARLFYENFDNAFLNIFPTFVDKVNLLLQPDGKIEVKPGKRLTTEARVLALIRLGITDNQSIAGILRASLTTIYTYRSKLKARAINKDSFEDDIKSIDC